MTSLDPFVQPPSDPPGAPQYAAPPPPADPRYIPQQPAPAIPQPARRAPINYQPNEAGWWYASDGLWYPPEAQPSAQQVVSGQPLVSNPSGNAQTVIVQVAPPAYPSWQPAYQPAIVSGAPRSKVAAGVLALLLGCFGVHRFYLGNNGLGVVMLLISVLSFGFLAPAVGLWAIVEGIIILTGGMRDAHGRALV